MGKTKRILVLYWYPVPKKEMRLAIKQHLEVLELLKPDYAIRYHNVYDNARRLRTLKYDAVIFHTTFLTMRWSHFFYDLKWKLRWIQNLTGLRIAIPQDEYDHSEILDEWLFELDVSIIFSCFNEDKRKTLYPLMHEQAMFYPALTGYIQEETAREIQPRLLPTSSRPNDIVYRATKLPYWFGSHGQLKHEIASVVKERAQSQGLTVDISTRESDTIVGDAWLDFIASGKAVIGCESGSSVLDRRGEIKARLQQMLRDDPTLTFEQVNSSMPDGWDRHAFFAISPRHLEAVITKTCQILVEGSYNHILLPGIHYIPIKRDFSNLDAVLDKTRDDGLLEEIAECAYQEIYLNGEYSYKNFARQIAQSIS